MFSSRPRSLAQRKGLFYEKLALKYLQGQGLSLLSQNFHCRFGEVDLILSDQGSIVFAEVRYRNNEVFGLAHETVDWHKQQKLIKCARYYLLRQGLYDRCDARFDVVSISGRDKHAMIRWFKNAFIPAS